jgi:hypothetical protein
MLTHISFNVMKSTSNFGYNDHGQSTEKSTNIHVVYQNTKTFVKTLNSKNPSSWQKGVGRGGG